MSIRRYRQTHSFIRSTHSSSALLQSQPQPKPIPHPFHRIDPPNSIAHAQTGSSDRPIDRPSSHGVFAIVGPRLRAARGAAAIAARGARPGTSACNLMLDEGPYLLRVWLHRSIQSMYRSVDRLINRFDRFLQNTCTCRTSSPHPRPHAPTVLVRPGAPALPPPQGPHVPDPLIAGPAGHGPR